MRGTDVYGDPKKAPGKSWSIKWDNTKIKEFMFMSGNGKLWLVATKEAVLGWYANGARSIVGASCQNNGKSPVKWYRRKGAKEDPWISIDDHHPAISKGTIVYGENNFGHTHGMTVFNNNGFDVYVR